MLITRIKWDNSFRTVSGLCTWQVMMTMMMTMMMMMTCDTKHFHLHTCMCPHFPCSPNRGPVSEPCSSDSQSLCSYILGRSKGLWLAPCDSQDKEVEATGRQILVPHREIYLSWSEVSKNDCLKKACFLFLAAHGQERLAGHLQRML